MKRIRSSAEFAQTGQYMGRLVHHHYLDIAEQAALRSTCLKRNFGAAIVKDDEIISTGYASVPRDTSDCNEVGFCYRTELGARRGENYEFCRSVHAEQNAIIQAPREQLSGGLLYLVGLDAKTKEPLKDTEPCRICKRLIAAAGIQTVIARQGDGKIREYSVREWLENNFWELRNKGGRFVPARPPRTLSDPVDEERADRLISRFALAEAVVVQVTSYEQAKHAVGWMAARYFVANVTMGDSVALSCGDTALSMLESLPRQPEVQLAINQLSIEGDPATIHQAPATLVGLLRAKCSPESEVLGLQLPPLSLVGSSSTLRREITESDLLDELKKKARSSDYVFIGVGSAGSDCTGFWAMAQAATGDNFDTFVKQLGIVGEINNQVFDASGENCTHKIPEFDSHVINVLTLEDIREMARKPAEQKVVMLATGEAKTEAMRVALETGLANVLITGREDADRLLAD